MSVVTIFGELEWGDDGSLQEFLSNHNQAHIDLNAAMAQRGIALGDVHLENSPDNQWFADHWLIHKTLDQALQVSDAPGLGSNWTGPRDFYDWHKINNDAHVLYAQVTGTE